MKTKKTPQDWYINSLCKILVDRDKYIGNFEKDEAYKYVIKSFTDKYSNTFRFDDGNLINVYWESFKQDYYTMFFDSLIISQKAYDYLNDNPPQIDVKKYLHLEHLTPMGYSRRKLLEIMSYDYENVKSCFKYAVVALITKEESRELDSGGILLEQDLITLKRFRKRHTDEIDESEIIEAQRLFENKEKLKSQGNGLIRLIHLYNTGVKFVNKDGKLLDINKLYKMLRDNTFKMHQYK